MQREAASYMRTIPCTLFMLARQPSDKEFKGYTKDLSHKTRHTPGHIAKAP